MNELTTKQVKQLIEILQTGRFTEIKAYISFDGTKQGAMVLLN